MLVVVIGDAGVVVVGGVLEVEVVVAVVFFFFFCCGVRFVFWSKLLFCFCYKGGVRIPGRSILCPPPSPPWS